MYINFSEIQGVKIDKPFERELKFIMQQENNFSLILSTLAPNGGCTDHHTHDTSGELMIFLSGHGKAWLQGVEYPLMPGVALYAAPGSEHRTLNTGSVPLVIACIFIPSVSSEYIMQNLRHAVNAKEGANEKT